MKKPNKISQIVLISGGALWLLAIAVHLLHQPEKDSLDQDIAAANADLARLVASTADRAALAATTIEATKAAFWTEATLEKWKGSLAQEWIAEPYGPAELRSVSLQTYTFELEQAPYDTGWPSIIKTIRNLTEQKNATIRAVTIQGAPSPAQFFQRVFISATFASTLP